MSDAAEPKLRIAVLVKQVPALNAVTVDPETQHAVLGSERVMNTYDGYAVSEAVDLKERFGAEVTAITLGVTGANEVLLRAMATGVDTAIHLRTDDAFSGDSLATAEVLAHAIKDHPFDLVLAGQTADDYESGQTGIQVAELLGWPHLTLVTEIDLPSPGIAHVRRDAEGAKERLECPTPAVLIILSGRDGSQRFPTLRGMMAAKKRSIASVDVSPSGPKRLTWSVPKAVERHADGVILEGLGPDEAADRLIDWLKERRLV